MPRDAMTIPRQRQDDKGDTMIPTTIAPHGIIGASGLPRNASLDIDAYFPVDPERRWGVISTRQRRNGETIVEDLHWKIHGQR